MLLPPIRPGISLTVKDGKFVLATSLENTSDESVRLSTMTSTLFKPTLSEKSGETLWTPMRLSAQAVTRWELEAGGKITEHFHIMNREEAKKTAEERVRELSENTRIYQDEEDIDIHVGPVKSRDEVDSVGTAYHETAVEPSEVGIVIASVLVPATRSTSLKMTRQFDLRHGLDDLDDESEFPERSLDAIRSPSHSTELQLEE